MATRPDPGAGGSTGVNIQALNNALNVFSSVVQQVATTATGQAPQNNADHGSHSARLQANHGTSQTVSQVVTSSVSGQASTSGAQSVLPSFLKRKGVIGGRDRGKKRKLSVSWDRDIICLPRTTKKGEVVNVFSYPRKKFRTQLGAWDLIGKLHLTSDMSVDDVASEVRSVFRVPMHNNPSFPFTFLQPTGGGNKTLTVPSVSASYQWTAQQVAKLASNRGSVYIMAMSDLYLRDVDSEEDSGADSETSNRDCPQTNETESPRRETISNSSVSENTPGTLKMSSTSAALSSDASYREYLDIIDLTGEHSGSADSDSELDELPPPAVAIKALSNTDMKEDKLDMVVLKHALLQHQHRVIKASDEEDFQRISVRRSHLYLDALRAFSKPTFNVGKMLKVCFIGEPAAIDDGGPRREFFSLLTREIFRTSGLFSGWPEHAVPVHDVHAVANNRFYVVGKMLATCLVQGGEPPVCLAKAVADYIVFDSIRSPPCIDDIPDFEIKQLLLKIKRTTTRQEFISEIQKEEFDFRFNCGYSKPTTSMDISDREEFVKAIWLHYIFFLPHAELEQLRKGLRETLQVEILACLHGELLHSVLASTRAFEPTSKHLIDQIVVAYSHEGSNNRTHEESIILNWSEYVSECETKGVEGVYLADLSQFFTGARKVPVTGFDTTLKIKFSNEAMLPKASTCDCSITFSRSWSLLMDDEFQQKLSECILGSVGFGQV